MLHDLDTDLIRAVGITSANVPGANVTSDISADLERQGVCLKELHIDRAYLSSHLVKRIIPLFPGDFYGNLLIEQTGYLRQSMQ